jgi:MerR family transcriptional regulator, light-induced transcriptional regulator
LGINLTMDGSHSIKVAAMRTGLSPHVIRIWEKRYGAVTPTRTDTNRRLYSDKEIERLNLLKLATRAGHNIGNIAHHQTDDLKNLLREDASCAPNPIALDTSTEKTSPESNTSKILVEALKAIQELDGPELHRILGSANVLLGQQGLLQDIIIPLTREIGSRWENGSLTMAHEHFTSSILRTFLGNSAKPYTHSVNAPNLIVATPAGQLHELGAVIVAVAATSKGWKITYLGANLPAAEIAGAARQTRAKAVALSLIYPPDDPNIRRELELLREYLPESTEILAGGQAAIAYLDTLHSIGARVAFDLKELYPMLDDIRIERQAAPHI